VARLVPVLYPQTRPFISNVITLGTPHAHPVFGWESSIHHLHETYLADPNDDNRHTLVAISGGIRDEMIPPVACQAAATPQTLSVLSTDIMEPKTNGAKHLGMDHRAIVWCHNLLSVVRGVIFTLVRDLDKQPHVRMESVQTYLGLQVISEDYSYDKRLQEHQSQFTVGTVSAMH
jgi:PGAP1-like protein